MKIIYKHFFYIFFSFLVIYIFMLAISSVSNQCSSKKNIDTACSTKSIMYPETRYFLFNITRLNIEKKNIILLGASDVRDAFRPSLLNPYFINYNVHNVSIGASNITSISQIIDFINDTIPKKYHKNTIFVFGSTCFDYENNQRRWHLTNGNTDLTLEALRFWLYKWQNRRLIPTLHEPLFTYVTFLLRPYLLVNKLYVDFKILADSLIDRVSYYQANHIKNKSATNSQKKIEHALEHWQNNFGPITHDFYHEQFRALLKMAEKINQHGEKLIIVDMPLPQWHAHISPYFVAYQLQKTKYFTQLIKMPNVYYINLQNFNDNSGFLDSAHPNPTYAKILSIALVHRLKSIIIE